MSDDLGHALADEGLAVILDRVEALVRRYVILTADQACAVTLWVAHTWAIDFAYCTPYLAVTSPEKRSGKTRLLEVLDTLVSKAWLTGGTSKAALVRKIDLAEPTLLLDESDAAFNGDKEYAEALRGVLNNGYTRGKHYTTCIGQGTGIKPHDFKVFCPKAIAGIGRLPDTVVDRSIPIKLKRRAPGERVERFRQRSAENEGSHLANALDQLRKIDGFKPLDGAEPDLPEELDDRAQDVWEPLLAIADVAGSGLPARARSAAKRLSTGADVDDDSIAVRLFADCRGAFRDQDAIPSVALLDHLQGIEEAPWGDWHGGKAISARKVADLLRPYGIKSRSIRVGDKTPKGYRREQFEDAWQRYLPACSRSENATSATSPSTSRGSALFNPPQDSVVADAERVENPHNRANVADVADWRGGTGKESGSDTAAEGREAAQLAAAQRLVDVGIAEWINDPDPEGDRVVWDFTRRNRDTSDTGDAREGKRESERQAAA